MVMLSKPAALGQFSLVQTCQPTSVFNSVPAIDLSEPDAKALIIVEACKECGFFKVINYDGVPLECMSRLEAEAIKFFNFPQTEKDKLAVPLGYGSRKIGPNGDVGWVEYVLQSTSSTVLHQISPSLSKDNPGVFQDALRHYLSAVKGLACEVLELIAEGLRIQPKTVIADLLREKCDSLSRVNHLPTMQLLRASNGIEWPLCSWLWRAHRPTYNICAEV